MKADKFVLSSVHIRKDRESIISKTLKSFKKIIQYFRKQLPTSTSKKKPLLLSHSMVDEFIIDLN